MLEVREQPVHLRLEMPLEMPRIGLYLTGRRAVVGDLDGHGHSHDDAPLLHLHHLRGCPR